MRTLFTLDLHDYEPDMPVHLRQAVRALIRQGDLWLMQQNGKGEYKFPGGGIDPGETSEQALVREVMEETGMRLIPGSIQPVGEVIERRRDTYRDPTRIFEQQSCYFLCEAEETGEPPAMTPAELSWGMHPVWVSLDDAIRDNQLIQTAHWMVRDTMLMSWLRDTLNNHQEVVDL